MAAAAVVATGCRAYTCTVWGRPSRQSPTKETATPRPAYLSAAPPPSLPSRGKQSLRSVGRWSTRCTPRRFAWPRSPTLALTSAGRCRESRKKINKIHLMMRRAPRPHLGGRVQWYRHNLFGTLLCTELVACVINLPPSKSYEIRCLNFN